MSAMRAPLSPKTHRRRWAMDSGRLASALLALGILLAMRTRVDAYLDPGTGDYLLRMLAAAVISIGFIVRGSWRSLRDGLTRRLTLGT